MTRLTLPEDSNARKRIPVYSGAVAYFPAALAGVAYHSMKCNDKHNPGEEMHHARGKSMDHIDCLQRHLMDLADLLAALRRGEDVSIRQILDEADAQSWRSLAIAQELHETLRGAPLAPGAKPAEIISMKSAEQIADFIERLNTGYDPTS